MASTGEFGKGKSRREVVPDSCSCSRRGWSTWAEERSSYLTPLAGHKKKKVEGLEWGVMNAPRAPSFVFKPADLRHCVWYCLPHSFVAFGALRIARAQNGALSEPWERPCGGLYAPRTSAAGKHGYSTHSCCHGTWAKAGSGCTPAASVSSYRGGESNSSVARDELQTWFRKLVGHLEEREAARQ